MESRLRVSIDDFDPGAIASFIGLVRGRSDGVQAMTLEHYPGMTEKQVAALIEQAGTRWSLDRVTVIHRVGRLQPGARIVFVGVAARHRAEAFAACEFLIDWLKTRAPFWKLEETPAGDRWVGVLSSDEERARRW
jgi:molybdopterin synthase catalytic subunit